jgi:serine/threonine protein kinase
VSSDRERSDDELARTETAPGSEPRNDAGAPLGAHLGRYKLQREIGRGGMGVVHAAFDPDLERKVALKVLKGDVDDQARQRLLREARAMARLTHPNVVTVHEVGSVGGRDYIAMELIDGVTLDEWLAQAKRSEREIINAMLAAGRGLAAAHAAGLVHRDFKPRNVLRHKDGRIVVTDFGLVVGVGDPALSQSRVDMHASTEGEETPSSLSGLTEGAISAASRRSCA